MKSFRDILDFWNEAGLIASVCVCVGYFGSRSLLGVFPQTVAIVLAVAAIVLAFLMSRSAEAEDHDYFDRPRNTQTDKFIWLTVSFLFGVAGVIFLGTLI